MAKDKLCIEERRAEGYVIPGGLADEGDMGASLGEAFGDDPEPKDRADWEAWKANVTAATTDNVQRDRDTGEFW